MKAVKYLGIALGLVALSSSANATVLINGSFGQAFANLASSGNTTTVVPNGTLWALIVDGGDGVLPAGLSSGQSIGAKAAANLIATTAAAEASFGNRSFTLGSLFGTDTVFALGGFTGGAGAPGTAAPALDLTLNINGLVTGRTYGFYYFPGVTFSNAAATYASAGTVGGINGVADASAALDAMIVPADNYAGSQGFNTTIGALGGETPNTSMTTVIVSAVPEPSSALLGAFCALGLLRRRRN